jgi:hypothetical protein
MSNLSRLTAAGIIVSSATFNQADQATLDSLTDDEVSALISINQKVPASFLQQHCGVQTAQPAPNVRTIGIVF